MEKLKNIWFYYFLYRQIQVNSCKVLKMNIV